MSALPIHLWFHAAYSAPYKGGGWAWVKLQDGELTGAAGGERNVTIERLELLGLSSVTPGLPAGAEVLIHTANARLAVLPRLLAGVAGEDAPETDLDVWAKLMTAFAGRPTRVGVGAVEGDKALGFVAAWAELGRDKAKGGAFRSPIPKANLVRAAAVLRA